MRIPLRRFEDERGWFCELRRESLLPRATVQTNVSSSRRGVIRGLHFHERGQDDLFACLQGTARVVVLDRATGATFTEDIGDDNPLALYIPGRHAHGFEALTDLLFAYHVTEEYDPSDPDEQGIPWDDPRVKDLWSTPDSDPLSARQRRRRVLITGAGGQLGAALAVAFAADDVCALTHADWDVRFPAPATLQRPDVVLHAAAWTDVDGAEDDPQGAAEVNVGGTGHVEELGAPLVAYSSDYVFDGRKGTAYVESDSPSPLSVYGHTKLHGEAAAGERAWIVRSSWLFGPTGHNFVRTMLRLGAERDEVAVVADQRGCPTYVGHLAAATLELVDSAAPFGIWHLAAGGECTWAELAEAIFEEAQLDCRVRRITTAEFGASAPRPSVSILRSEKGAPELPHWRDGLTACLAALAR